MNHQTAQIVAASYRERAGKILEKSGTISLRSEMLYDHAAVWERVADALKPPVCTEAPNVP